MQSPALSSALMTLVCPACGRFFDPDHLQTYCRDCVRTPFATPLLARYDLEALRGKLLLGEIMKRPRGMWRWAELLPVRDPAYRISLGEGDTPLLQAPRLSAMLGLSSLFIKDESLNPTGTFKARGLSVAVSRALELGIHRFVIPTAGNAGGALAAYAARANCEAHVFMPSDAPLVNRREVQVAGASLHLVEGLISDAARLAAAEAARQNWFDVSTFKEPYRVEGKKTMGLELAEAFGWQLPDIILYPTGGGTGLVGMWKAFEELQSLGWIGEKLPRMVSVQAEGCAPVVKAFQSGAEETEFWPEAHTIAAGLRVPQPFAGRLLLQILRKSQGAAVAVSDEEILAAQRQLARLEGIFAAPEGAATLAALSHLLAQGWAQPDDKIVLFNTGSGLKYVS